MAKTTETIVYDDPLAGRRTFKDRAGFTEAAEHEKWCCNCRYCHHPHYWRFDSEDCEDGERKVVMEVCQCRRHSPVGNGFPSVRADDWCGEFDRTDNCW